MTDLPALLGKLDIYLVDQLLRGRIGADRRICDVGCGGGRNLAFFLREGYECWGLDPDPRAIATLRTLAEKLAPGTPTDRFRAEPAEANGLPEEHFDVVIASAVLHFARDDSHFEAMVAGAWRLLAPGGLFFARLASDIGMEGRFQPLGGHRFRLLDGSERYLVDAERLLHLTDRLGGELLDPLKTTVVQDLRAMTTWVVGKGRRNPEPGPS
jgi:SAM-dependent methyltransferase